MTMKYFEMEMGDIPEMTPEEFLKLPLEERAEFIKRSIDVIKRRSFMLAFAVIKYGKHDESCTDEEVCTCHFTPVQELALNTIEALEGGLATGITVN